MANEEQKAIIKEALSEWLEAKWALLGKWTATGLAAAAFAVLMYFYLSAAGYHR